MSHWHSGLPKLDIQPFDASELYDAVNTEATANAAAAERRDKRRPFVIAVVAAFVGIAVVAALATILIS
ncbi:hypothetical protein JQN72_12285 [Phycicoccus sp. CSK15P-2]|uniref:hypothetical protein n=1 Tax=Phycicoccus sp. CSK15P-2 TaxID=2807627 RepID=UPI00194E2706|nr:hypothetical protein [Phycicoccus sp. CSK15P-2]MBM6405021.1 hypothetical protein [Phycicoccus sp. CSK15P-2]